VGDFGQYLAKVMAEEKEVVMLEGVVTLEFGYRG